MSAKNDKRLTEARECIERAENHLKTSIFKLKLKPDYDLACSEYERAATCYRNAGDLSQAIEMYLKTADCHQNTGNKFHTAKATEMAGMVAKDSGDLKKAIELFREAANNYKQCNSNDTAAMLMEKTGKIAEDVSADEAIKIYSEGLKVAHVADRPKSAMNFLQRLIVLQLKKNEYLTARQTSETLIEAFKESGDYAKIGSIGLGIVIMELLREDSVAARKALPYLSEINGQSFNSELSIANSLIVAYEAGDDIELQELLKSGVIRSMDNAYLRVIKNLHTCGNKAANDDSVDDEENLR